MFKGFLSLIKDHPQYIAYWALHYFFSGLGQSFLISIFAVYFYRSHNITVDTFNLLYLCATVTSATILPFLGPLIDKIKIRHFSTIVGFGLILCCINIYYSQNFISLLTGIIGLRLFGQGLMPLTGSTGIARFFDEKRGKALSLAGLGSPLSETFFSLIISFLLIHYDWRTIWLILGGGVLFLFIPLCWTLIGANNAFQTNKLITNSASSITGFSRKQVIKDWRFYCIVPAILFPPFYFTGFVMNHNMLEPLKGWSLDWIRYCIAGFGITRLVVNLLAGPLVDYFSSKKLIVYYLAPILFGIGLLGIDSKIALLCFFCLAGVTTSFGSIFSSAMWAELYGTKHLGAIKSMATSLLVYSTAAGPIALAWSFKNLENFHVSIIISLVAIIILMFLSFIGIRKS